MKVHPRIWNPYGARVVCIACGVDETTWHATMGSAHSAIATGIAAHRFCIASPEAIRAWVDPERSARSAQSEG